MIKIEPVLWSCRLPLEVIFIGVIPFLFIIQIISTDCDHWLFDIIQNSASFFNLITWCNLLTWWYWFIWQWADNIGWRDDFVLDIIQKTYWIQTQVKHLIVQSTFKSILAREVVNCIPNTTRPGIGNCSHWLDTVVDWRILPGFHRINMV